MSVDRHLILGLNILTTTLRWNVIQFGNWVQVVKEELYLLLLKKQRLLIVVVCISSKPFCMIVIFFSLGVKVVYV